MTQFVKVGSRTDFEDLEGGKLVDSLWTSHRCLQCGRKLLCDREYVPSSWWPSRRGNGGG
jgi:hypothetical protein